MFKTFFHIKPYLVGQDKRIAPYWQCSFLFFSIIKMSYNEKSSASAVPETMVRVTCLPRLVTNCLSTTIASMYFHFTGL